MATTYKATLNVQCWKQHCCVHCEKNFRYLLSREVTGQGASEPLAVNAAQDAAVKAIESEVDYHACPHCGVVQPEMVAEVKSTYFGIALAVGCIGVALALILGLPHLFSITISATIAVVASLISLALVIMGVRHHPNGSLESNRAESQTKVSNKTLFVDEVQGSPGPRPMDYEQPGSTVAAGAVVLMSLLAVLVAASPEILRMTGGWHKNADFYPAVVGPGDTSCYYMSTQITSLKGYWTGSVNAVIQQPPKFNDTPVRGETKNSTWGDTISGKSLSNTTSRMWCYLTFPEQPDMSGEKLRVNVSVNATFPLETGGGFDDKTGQFTSTSDVTLASPGAGTLYSRSWWGGQLLAIGLIIAGGGGGLLLARSLKGHTNPTEVFPVETPESQQGGTTV